MTDSSNSTPITAAQALKKTRTAWACSLFAQLLLFTAGLFVATKHQGPPDPQQAKLLSVVLLVVFVATPMLAFMTRMQAYKKGYVVDRVEPKAYMSGNIMVFVALTLITLIAGCVAAITGIVTHPFLIAICNAGLVVMNFPNGKPMQAPRPELAD